MRSQMCRFTSRRVLPAERSGKDLIGSKTCCLLRRNGSPQRAPPGTRGIAGTGRGASSEGDIDLLDYAALMTLRDGGSVMLVGRELLPPPGLCAAILRY